MALRHGWMLVFAAGCAPDIKPPPKPAPTVVAQFDPLNPAGPVVPKPTDLALIGGNGHLNIPNAPTDAPAQRDLNAYLNTLDGFPSTTDGTAQFSGAVKPDSVRPLDPAVGGSVIVVDLKTSPPSVLGKDAVSASVDAGGMNLTVHPTARWKSGHQYAVALVGGSDTNGLAGAAGEMVVASPVFFFLRSAKPVLGICGDGTGTCACPDDVVKKADPADPTCHAVVSGIDDGQARTLEGSRRQMDGALTAVTNALPSAVKIKRTDIALAWTFTISTAPMTVFDPARADIPSPNDILIDQMSHLVKLPIAMNDPQATVKMGLNMLDGYSVSAPAVDAVDVTDNAAIDPKTLLPGETVLLINGSNPGAAPQFAAAPVFVNGGKTFAGQIAVAPLHALESDQTQYVVVVTTDVTDTNGHKLQPPPIMALLRSTNPLQDPMTKKSLVPSALDDASAAQLEPLRAAYQEKLFGPLQMIFNIPPEKIAMVWTYTTQSVTRPLLALAAYPDSAKIPTAATITKTLTAAQITAANPPFAAGNIGALAFGTVTTHDVNNRASTGMIAFDRTPGADPMNPVFDTFSVHGTGTAQTIKFWLALPKMPATGKVPIAILRHGIFNWRGVMLPIADVLAAQGWASIGVDTILHGDRSICSKDADCASGGTCSLMTGVCSTTLSCKPVTVDDPYAADIQTLTGDPTDCEPLATGATFASADNLFSTRDNLRQSVVDLTQLVRILKDTSPAGLAALTSAMLPAVASFDGGNIGFLGTSAGAIDGALFLATSPDVKVASLNVPGAHPYDIFADGKFHPLIDAYLMKIGVMRDSAAYNQVIATARWILDPGDPYSIARDLFRRPLTSYVTMAPVPPKVILQQEAGTDDTVPDVYQELLALEIFGDSGLDGNHHVQSRQTDSMIVSTYFGSALHGSLVIPFPSVADPHVTAAERLQAATWLATGGAKITDVGPP